MNLDDKNYCGISWKSGGRTREGLDCRGLAELFLREQCNFVAKTPKTPLSENEKHSLAEKFLADARVEKNRGDLVFFRRKKTGKITHVAVYLGGNKYLHIVACGGSRIDNGLRLIERLGYARAGAVSPAEAEKVCALLDVPRLGHILPGLLVGLLVSAILSVASAFLLPRPNLGKFRNQTGRYGFDALITKSAPDLPLPDVLGKVTVAGNSPFQSVVDKTLTVSDATQQGASKVVVLCAGPMSNFANAPWDIRINGIQLDNTNWGGFSINPPQTKAGAVSATSVTIYNGTHDIEVPVDIRASFDRNFPVYGFNGCAYLALRLIDSTKFSTFNLTAAVKGRSCRQIDTSGFVRTSVSGESLSGADGSKVKFKLANEDIEAVTALTVNGTSYSVQTATNQTGNVFHLNKTKGYVQFVTAPAAAATMLVDYSYLPRSWTTNPAVILVYLLTEPLRGKGFDESKIDFGAAVTLANYCNASITWQNSNGTFTQARYSCNYVLDFRKDVQDHIRAVLDSCFSVLFQSNGKWVMKARKAESSVFSFDESNILVEAGKSTFWSQQIERNERSNRVQVFYHPEQTFNSETDASRDDQADQQALAARIGNRGILAMQLKTPAIADQVQAERLAETILREEVGARWICGFKTNIQGLAVEVGDVVDVTHGSQPAWAEKLFRVEDLGYDEADRLELKLSEYVASAFI